MGDPFCYCIRVLGPPEQGTTGWGLKQQKFVFSQLPTSQVGWKSKIKVLVGGFLLRPLSWARRWSPFPCVLTWPFLVSLSSYKTTSQIGFGPGLALVTSLKSRSPHAVTF